LTQKATAATESLRERTNESASDLLAALRPAARDGDSRAKAALAERLLTRAPYSLAVRRSLARNGGSPNGSGDGAHDFR
jgi:hypothetical protein